MHTHQLQKNCCAQLICLGHLAQVHYSMFLCYFILDCFKGGIERLVPWHEVAVNLIGPWETEMHEYTFSFTALTAIDIVTNYCKVVRITTKQAAYSGLMFENTQLSHYPKPMHCIFDQGGEFTEVGF